MISKFWPYKEGGPVQILDSYYYCQIVFQIFALLTHKYSKCVLVILYANIYLEVEKLGQC